MLAISLSLHAILAWWQEEEHETTKQNKIRDAEIAGLNECEDILCAWSVDENK